MVWLLGLAFNIKFALRPTRSRTFFSNKIKNLGTAAATYFAAAAQESERKQF